MAHTYQLLIVDDDPVERELFSQILGEKYSVRSASNGQEAILSATVRPPDLILLDVSMPEMDGYHVCEKLKKNPKTQDIPIIFITGRSSAEDEVQGLTIGAIDYLSKPVHPSIMKARVQNHLELKYLRDKERAHHRFVNAEKAKSDALLHNILPDTIVGKLKDYKGHVAENHPDATVLFADIVGFTPLSEKISASELVRLLNRIFSTFDRLVEKHGVEKIKTIGDAYMVVGGVPVVKKNHSVAIADLAFDMLDVIGQYTGADGKALKIRIGIHSGQVMAGVIGVKKFVYDLWGDTVNTASRMESQGVPDHIHVTGAIYHRLKDRFVFEKRGPIYVKGKGEMVTYFLQGRTGDERSRLFRDTLRLTGETNYGLSKAKEELATLPLIDDLTGLHSRNGFVALVSQQLQMATREERNILLVLLRLENLDQINVQFGFSEGENALKQVTGLIIEAYRSSDIVGRTGENLFLIFGLEKDQAGENLMTDRIRKALASFNAAGTLAYEMTLSVSEGRWPFGDPIVIEDLFQHMEKQLEVITFP